MLRFACKAREIIGENRISPILNGSSFDPVCLAAAVARSAEVDWTAFGSLDNWCPYRWDTVELFDLPEGHRTVWRRRPLDGDVPFTHRALWGLTARSARQGLLLMDEAHARILGPEAAPSLASVAMGGSWHDDELVPYSDEDEGH